MKNIFSLIFLFVLFFSISAQNSNESYINKTITSTKVERPKLVIGIVVDQMRYDYLTRFEYKFGEGGFKRMIREGFNCKNNYFNYVPTVERQRNLDTHVPLLFFGNGIKHGEAYEKKVIPDIAPTISALLGISFPNGATGEVLGLINTIF